MKILYVSYIPVSIEAAQFIKFLPTALGSIRSSDVGAVQVDTISPITEHQIQYNLTNTFIVDQISVTFGSKVHTVSVLKHLDHTCNRFYLSHSAFLSEKFAKRFLKECLGDDYSDSEWQQNIYLFFSACVLEFISFGFNTYDVINLVDIEAGLLPTLIKKNFGKLAPAIILSVFDITKEISASSNLAKQLYRLLKINFNILRNISFNSINFLTNSSSKSDFISTPSMSYAKNLTFRDISPDLSFALEKKNDRLVGINLGFDYTKVLNTFDTLSLEDIRKEKFKYKVRLLKNFDLLVDNEHASKLPLYAYQLDSKRLQVSLIQKVLNTIKNKPGFHLILVDQSNYDKACELFNFPNTRCVISDLNHLKFLSKPHQKLLVLLKSLDFFVLLDKVPLRTDIIALLNYCGVLPIGFAGGVCKDLIREGRNGFLFNSYNVKSFELAFNKSVNVYNSSAHLEMLKTSLAMRFSWETTAQKYLDLYEKAVQFKKHELDK